MPLLRFPRCPACGSATDLPHLYNPMRTRRPGLVLQGPVAINCRTCGAILRVRQWPIFALFLLVIAIPSGALLVVPKQWNLPQEEIDRTLFGFGLVLFILHMCYANRFVRLSVVQEAARWRFPLDDLMVTRDNDLEFAALEDQLKEEAAWVEFAQKHPAPAWRCGKCGEENPGVYELCWNCETERPTKSGI